MTSQEIRLWLALRALRPQGLHFRRQVPLAGYVLDFACLKARLAIEVDGSHHANGEQASHDCERDRRLDLMGFKTLRFWNPEVDRNLDGVVETIIHHARERMDALR
jgi:very-short-patch-repair endonuclease